MKNSISNKPPTRIYVCGVGAQKDGTPARCVSVNARTKKRKIHEIAGLTKAQSEWFAIEAELRDMRPGTKVEVVCTAPLVVAQFKEQSPITTRRTAALVARVVQHERNGIFIVDCIWLPRAQNVAAKRLSATTRGADSGVGGKLSVRASVPLSDSGPVDDLAASTGQNNAREIVTDERFASEIPDKDRRVIYIAARPPRCVWLCQTTSKQRFGRAYNRTTSELVWLGALSALKVVPERHRVLLHSGSATFLAQFNEWPDARRPKDQKLIDRVRTLIVKKRLTVDAISPWPKNLAFKLLRDEEGAADGRP